ncbi:MAG TPA: hypothetical protein VEL76_17595 [Gemmataceae bacterium]|nr:hypothetical protein [Gemmataceae bacterium]
MLALTIRQPFAALILRGLKTVEYRRFHLPLGVDIALHTSRALAGPAELEAARLACAGASDQAVLRWLSQLHRGKIVAVFRCTGHSSAPVEYVRRGWPIANMIEVIEELAEPIRAIGQPGLWDWTASSPATEPHQQGELFL